MSTGSCKIFSADRARAIEFVQDAPIDPKDVYALMKSHAACEEEPDEFDEESPWNPGVLEAGVTCKPS